MKIRLVALLRITIYKRDTTTLAQYSLALKCQVLPSFLSFTFYQYFALFKVWLVIGICNILACFSNINNAVQSDTYLSLYRLYL